MNMSVTQRLRDWIAASPDDFSAAQTAWTASLGDAGLHFEGRPYPVSLRPLVLGSDEFERLEQACGQLLAVLEKVLDLYRAMPEVRRFFAAYQAAESATLAYPSYRPLIRVCRFDCVWFGGDDFKLLETNMACPGGVIQNGLATRLWHDARGTPLLTSQLRLLGQPLVVDQHTFVKELVAVARGMGVNEPSAAVVNLKGCYTNEVDWMVAGLGDLGVPAQQCDARDLQLRDDGLYAGDRRVSLTYNKLDPLMLLDEPEVRDYLQAIAQETVCAVNPLVAQLVGEDKSILAFLSDPQHAEFFTTEEIAVIERHVPWTRVLGRGRTTVVGGAWADLPTYVAEHRTSLVLKPSNLTRGEGVVIGAHTTAAGWHGAIEAALRRQYIVQEYVPLPSIEVPLSDAPALIPMQHGLDCYIFGGRLVGFQSRASVNPVVNVGQGGWLLPVLHAEAM